MKNLFVLLPLLLLCSFKTMEGELTKADRKFAISELKNTYLHLKKTIAGLSAEQLSYKPTPEAWSIQENVYHLAISESMIWDWMQKTAAAPANPEKKADIKLTGQQVIDKVSDRTMKVKTREPFEPKNAKWSSAAEALQVMADLRDDHIDYLRKTTDALHNHVTESPLGALDAYQLVLFMGGHTTRHTRQIEEVMADPGFPK